MPAYWLLVPGAMGLIGLAGLVGPHRQGGMQDLGTTVLTVIAVALETLIGFALT